MKKYLMGACVFALSLFVDMAPLTQTLRAIDQVDDAHAYTVWFGRAPLLGEGCEDGWGWCIDY